MSLIYRAMLFEKSVYSHKIINADWGEIYRVLECTGYHFSLVSGFRTKKTLLDSSCGMTFRVMLQVPHTCGHMYRCIEHTYTCTKYAHMHTHIHTTFRTASHHSQNR